MSITDLRFIPLDHDVLTQVFEQARATCTNPAWLVAMDKAYEQLSQMSLDGVLVEFDDQAHMRIESFETPGVFYWCNGTCTCPAGQSGKPCKHRAARQLVTRMLAAQTKPTRAVKTKAERHVAYQEAHAALLEAF